MFAVQSSMLCLMKDMIMGVEHHLRWIRYFQKSHILQDAVRIFHFGGWRFYTVDKVKVFSTF